MVERGSFFMRAATIAAFATGLATHSASTHAESVTPKTAVTEIDGLQPNLPGSLLLTEADTEASENYANQLQEYFRDKGPFNVFIGSSETANANALSSLSSVEGIELVYKFANIPAAIARISDENAIRTLVASNARYIQFADVPTHTETINEPVARKINIAQADQQHATGEGLSVAVIDTGIDTNHTIFTNRIKTQACFSTDQTCRNGLIQDVSLTAASTCAQSSDNCEHGTATSSLIADLSHADIIPIRADRYTSNIAMAFDWIISEKKAGRSIPAVNISLGWGEGVVGSCSAQELVFTELFQTASNEEDIAITIASGNNSYGNASMAPACITTSNDSHSDGIIATGASTINDTIADYSNRDSLTVHVVAPGDGALVAVAHERDQVEQSGGTSLAAPMAAASVARVHSLFPDMTPGEMESLFISSGQTITENYELGDQPGRSVTYRPSRIDVGRAVILEMIRRNPLKRLFMPLAFGNR